MNRLIQILIISAHTVERKGLGFLLNARSSLAVVGEASSIQEAIVMVKTSQPDAVLVDHDVLYHEGVDSVHRICRENENTVVFILFNGATARSSHMEIESGKIWLFTNHLTPDELVASIERIVCKRS